MRKRETAKKVFVKGAEISASKKQGPRSWKEYFQSAPRMPRDFPKHLRDPQPEPITLW